MRKQIVIIVVAVITFAITMGFLHVDNQAIAASPKFVDAVLQAVAYDYAGNVGYSAPVYVRVRLPR